MIVKNGLFAVGIALGIVTISLNGVAKVRGVTVSGENITYTEWQSVPAERLLLNLSDSTDIRLTRARQRERTGGVLQQTGYFPGGLMNIRYHPRSSFGERTTEILSDPESLKKRIRRYYERKKEAFSYGPLAQVAKPPERAGWVHRVRDHSGQVCQFGVIGFISQAKREKGYTVGRFDTVVWIKDCSGKRSLSQIAGFLMRVELAAIDSIGTGGAPSADR